MKPGKHPFHDILKTQLTTPPAQLRQQRILLIQKIQKLRGRPLVVYATNTDNAGPGIPAFIHPQDIIPLTEVIDQIEGDEIDFMLETPGGLAEVTVDIVNLLRPRFKHVAFIVPHHAMSAGTILVMSGDEILMDHKSSLGAIDPQFMGLDGRPQPAQAILAGIETIKQQVDANNGVIHPVYIPILRNVDPGKLQSAQNASELSRKLVSDWLAKYKFQNWTSKETTGAPVSEKDRLDRATEIASQLCDHQSWLSHSRPIKLSQLEEMKLKITDYGEHPELQEAIWTLWVHLHHMMTSTNIYKCYESEKLEFFKVATQQNAPPVQIPLPQKQANRPGPGNLPAPLPAGASAKSALANINCSTCGANYKIQFNFSPSVPLTNGAHSFPKNGMFTCPVCKTVMNLVGLKTNIEATVGKPTVL